MRHEDPLLACLIQAPLPSLARSLTVGCRSVVLCGDGSVAAAAREGALESGGAGCTGTAADASPWSSSPHSGSRSVGAVQQELAAHRASRLARRRIATSSWSSDR